MTASQLKAIVPALEAVSDAIVDAQILMSDAYFDVTRWGDFYAEGLACWVAHNLTVGSVSDATMLKQIPANPYVRTVWGQRYLFLVDQIGMGGMVV